MLEGLSVLDKIKHFYINEIPRDISTYNIKVEGNVNNRESLSLVSSMASTYSAKQNRFCDFNIRSKDLFKMKECSKFYWDILFTKGSVKFYLSMDTFNEELILNKARNSWNRCKISKEDSFNCELRRLIDANDKKYASCEIILKTYNYKTLSTDMSNQYPLTNMMSIIKMLKDDEFVRVNIAIEPQSRLNWISIAKDEKDNFNNGIILNNEVTLREQMMKKGFSIGEEFIDLYIELKLLPIECMFGIFLTDGLNLSVSKNNKDTQNNMRDNKKHNTKFDVYNYDDDVIELNSSLRKRSSSNYKSVAETFKTKITILSHSSDTNRARINMIAVGSSYKDLTDENELVMMLHDEKETIKAKEELKFNDVKIGKKTVLSDRELCKMIQLPQKTLQDEYKMDVIDTRESDIPMALQNGDIEIGIADEPSKNKKTRVTFPTDSNLLCRKTVYIGGENCGKTSQLLRLAKEFSNAGISNLILDHLENGKFGTSFKKVIRKDKYIEYDVFNQMPSLAFTEIQSLITEDMDRMTRLRYANMIAKQVIVFVNSITDEETGSLSGRMKRFLHSACMIVFVKPKAVINDVFNVLSRHDCRIKAMEYAKSSGLFDENDDVFTNMEELHKMNKYNEIVGTRDDLISGIINRISTLQQDPTIKEMLKKPYDENDNLDNYIQKGISVLVSIPQNKITDNDTRDMLATFYFSRLWLTAQLRKENKDSKICHVIIDEIKSLPTLAEFMEKYITEFRRNRIALTIACHSLQQFGKLLGQLLACGANFIIIASCEKSNIIALKDEIQPFTLEECLALKPFTALSVINYGNQYWKGVLKLNE